MDSQLTTKKPIKKSVEISQLLKALDFEESAKFINVEGHSGSFSYFMAKNLIQLAKSSELTVAKELSEKFKRYQLMDVLERNEVVKQTKRTLNELDNLKAQEVVQSSSSNFLNSKISNQPLNEIDVKWVPGVGEQLAKGLKKLGVTTIKDLLFYWPREHLNFANRVPINELKVGMQATVFGIIKKVSSFSSPKNPNLLITNIQVADQTGVLSLHKFIAGRSSKYLFSQFSNQFPKGSIVMVSGTVKFDKQTRFQLSNFSLEVIEKAGEDKTNNIAEVSSQSLEVGRIVPIYKLTEGVSQPRLRKAIFNALQKFTSQVEELVPKQIIEQKALRPLQEAIKQMHFPDSEEDLLLAKKTISFMEFWFMQLPLAIKREENKQKQFEKEKRKVLLQPNGLVNSLLKNLPFDLTGAQRRVFNEIIKDLSLVTPMNRLVQGDVGSGKTIVALLTMLVAVERGFQASMMAPTEILAEQHFAKFQPMLLELGVNSCFLSGSMKVAEKREALTSIANGQAQIIIGTHALIQEGVEFANLGMVVVDEQHRFGVKQRDFLRRKGKNEEEAEKLALIDCLHMTATPIPRTLTLALYGNLDLSEIDELPPGRKPIKTKIIEAKKRSSAYDFVKKELKEGRQAYIVYPLIEESESLSAKAVTEEAEKLKETFSDFKVAVIHGKMRPEEKDNVMNSFRKNETQILLGTTVIEVGVDVPNASIMIIENAERFGLAQLHQLRGRVGRGSSQSYCMLFSGSKSVVSAERLSVMEQTENGFIIAQKDLELRGPGELMGTRQSGLSDFALASLMEFGYLLEEARNSANEFIHNNLELKGLPSEGRKKLNKTLEAASSIEGG